MAKKDPTDLSVEERLKALYQLQTALSAIDEKKALRGELPLEVKDLEDEIEGLSTRVEKIQTEIDEYQKAIALKKGEIIEAQASVDRYKNQLNEVKNNREYDTLSKEIEFQSLEIELCNKKIKEAVARVAERTATLEDTQKVIEERKSDKNAQPLSLSKQDVKTMLESCGVSMERQNAFEEKYDQSFGSYAELPAVNMVTPKRFQVETASVSIKVDPAHSDLVQTRIIDGKCYIMVLADDNVKVNGVCVKIRE